MHNACGNCATNRKWHLAETRQAIRASNRSNLGRERPLLAGYLTISAFLLSCPLSYQSFLRKSLIPCWQRALFIQEVDYDPSAHISFD
jgi:hypothetical protein